ncbi:hypothetical protein A9P82_05425 [Arachidicoccus ginsenosidimutans]|uniref:hypothetical protein n=1 Tax=Arachidicoccus sp. BS20 TaxID=1850526 RepID=UPI0007F0A815|nr:hypothetical protein [Arachidicoccus sp. BS20]ANI88776.1 hypothetical protein A9P82_05425 [Arachidicoccus sp. BS20]
MYVELLLKEQEQKFQSQFKTLPNDRLVECFNKQVRCLSGNTIRRVYLSALKNEFLNRDFDCSIVLNKYGLRVQQKVRLENNRLVYAN